MTAPKGYYKQLISDSNIRIAFTHTPIYGCTVVDSSKVMSELEQSQDEYGLFKTRRIIFQILKTKQWQKLW